MGWSDSLALMSDAGHMMADSASLHLAALAAWFARKPPSRWHTYDFGTRGIVVALVNAVLILAVITTVGQRCAT